MAFSDKPQSLDFLLKQYLKRMPQKKEMKRGMILHLWPKVVGEQVTRATLDLYFDRDKLYVKVVNESWRHELTMNRFSIAKKLNEKVDGKIIKEIVVIS